MAHQSTVTGGVSELIATAALLNAGWQVSEPCVNEVYDRVARHLVFTNNEWVTLQIKSARIRDDRPGAKLVVYATKGDGSHYTPEDCDYLVGVYGSEVYLIRNRSLKEYWYPTFPTSETEWVLVDMTGKESEKEAI
jgi:hypothetical protein